MPSTKKAAVRARRAARRMPLTITLSQENYAFLDSCVSLKEFDSVDHFFDAALSFYRKHVRAVSTYAEEQISKGYSRAEILESIQCETLVTKHVQARSGSKRRR